MTLVSIITPSYNQGEFLEDTIRSVLRQDYPDLEYIIVDGASTDGSVEIIHKYADQLTWWVSEPDNGQADAINKGFHHAQGEVIAWLNSDDLYLPGAVSDAVASLQENPDTGMVFGDAVTIDQRGRPLNRLVFGDWGLEDLMGFRIICQPAVFIRKSVLEKAGYLDPSYQFMLDHHLWLRLAQQAPTEHISLVWAAARHHPEAKNVAHAAGFGEETFRLVEWMSTQPDLAPIFAKNKQKIEGGAHRLNARYLLDGEQPRPALQAYGKALITRPGFAMQHWHRMIYASLSLVGAGGAIDSFRRYKSALRNRQPVLPGSSEMTDWPGLDLNG